MLNAARTETSRSRGWTSRAGLHVQGQILTRTQLTETQFPFLGGLTPDGRRAVDAVRLARVARGARLLQRGDAANGAYLVVGGSLRVYYIGPEGREATLYHVEPGGTCILALTSTFNEEPYPAWVDAGPAGGVFACVPSALFRRLLDSESAFRSFVFAALSGRIFELMLTLEEAGTAQVEQRVARQLVRRHEASSGDEVRVTQISLASELGTAREVVFRALRSLARRGLIQTGRGRIRILDIDSLRRTASPLDAPQPARPK